MAIKLYRPTTPARRYYMVSSHEGLSRSGPRRQLLEPHKKHGGRNNTGRVTARRRGGGEKRFYRVIDFRRDKTGVLGKVAAIEYDPNRTARIALVKYLDGEYRYILCPEGVRPGDSVAAGRNLPVRAGNAMPLSDIPVGVEIHNLQILPESRSFMVRSAGTAAQILAREESWAVVKLPSGEIRRFDLRCSATIGRVSHAEHKDVSLGKAGRVRHRGWRPRSRAVAMNPVDHPMGGGEGKSSGGRHPCSPNGMIAKGFKTRNRKKASSRLILSRRRK
uniref:Large ribosomal subunit protein uL2 n=1 Tax=candidate division WOR-3 bacterium TaxID=2052148 RepID=A0A7C4CBK4_UNCW3